MTMSRPKAEFKSLTPRLIIDRNPDRKSLSGNKKTFKQLIVESAKSQPFDKKN